MPNILNNNVVYDDNTNRCYINQEMKTAMFKQLYFGMM